MRALKIMLFGNGCFNMIGNRFELDAIQRGGCEDGEKISLQNRRSPSV